MLDRPSFDRLLVITEPPPPLDETPALRPRITCKSPCAILLGSIKRRNVLWVSLDRLLVVTGVPPTLSELTAACPVEMASCSDVIDRGEWGPRSCPHELDWALQHPDLTEVMLDGGVGNEMMAVFGCWFSGQVFQNTCADGSCSPWPPSSEAERSDLLMNCQRFLQMSYDEGAGAELTGKTPLRNRNSAHDL